MITVLESIFEKAELIAPHWKLVIVTSNKK